jgi:hypothetical protein
MTGGFVKMQEKKEQLEKVRRAFRAIIGNSKKE